VLYVGSEVFCCSLSLQLLHVKPGHYLDVRPSWYVGSQTVNSALNGKMSISFQSE